VCVLDDVNTCLLKGFGCESFAGVRCTGFTDGDCLWDLSLGRCTGDGKFYGETFLGRLWMFFCEGRGGEEKESGHVQDGRFSLDDTRCQTDQFFYIVYYIVHASGHRVVHASGHRERWTGLDDLKFRQLTTSFTY
jgi:hypothetical protein